MRLNHIIYLYTLCVFNKYIYIYNIYICRYKSTRRVPRAAGFFTPTPPTGRILILYLPLSLAVTTHNIFYIYIIINYNTFIHIIYLQRFFCTHMHIGTLVHIYCILINCDRLSDGKYICRTRLRENHTIQCIMWVQIISIHILVKNTFRWLTIHNMLRKYFGESSLKPKL